MHTQRTHCGLIIDCVYEDDEYGWNQPKSMLLLIMPKRFERLIAASDATDLLL